MKEEKIPEREERHAPSADGNGAAPAGGAKTGAEEKGSDRKGFLKRIAGDSAWSLAGLMLMNLAAQFAVYPLWNRELGNERYGRILFLISAMNILAVSMGTACNYGRMKESAERETGNRIYRRILAVASLAAVPYMLAVSLISGEGGSPLETGLLVVLTVFTMWRFYADVGYRLTLNYRGFFVYYLTVSLGYGLGVLLFLRTGLWPLALLPGELAGVALVYLRGGVLRREPEGEPQAPERRVTRVVLALFLTEVINNLIFNGDRVLLNALLDGTSVSLYYQASLLGKTMALVATPLNSVLIGYLARSGGGLTQRLMRRMTAAALGGLVLVTAGCTLAAHVLISLLYPQNYALVRGYFLVANLAQVAYFISGIIATVLLRYGDIRYQLYINGVYAGLFLALCVPGTLLKGLDGFCWALLGVCVLRLAYVLMLAGRLAARQQSATQIREAAGETGEAGAGFSGTPGG